MTVHAEPIYALIGPDGSLVAEAESLDAIICAAATLREDGEDVDSMVVERAGQYDPATTALIQENMV